MLDRLLLAVTRRVSRRPRLTIALALVAVLAAGALGGGVIDRLGTGGFDDPASESSRGTRILEEQFAAGPSDVVLVVSTLDGAGSVDDPDVVAAGLELTARLAADPTLRDVLSYWTVPGAGALRSDDGSRALVLARGVHSDGVVTGEHVRETYSGLIAGPDGAQLLEVLAGGTASTYAELQETIE